MLSNVIASSNRLCWTLSELVFCAEAAKSSIYDSYFIHECDITGATLNLTKSAEKGQLLKPMYHHYQPFEIQTTASIIRSHIVLQYPLP